MRPDRSRLRRELRERRRAIPAPERIAAAQSLARNLLSLTIAPHTGYVAGYWAMGGEIALHAWQLQLPASLTYCLPVLVDEGLLAFAPWRPGEPLTTNRFGIPEPDVSPASLLGAGALAMVVMPLVGFDARCERLGMGGGWYDRSFAAAHRADRKIGTPGRPALIGAAFSTQQVDDLPSQPWDVPLDAVCTDRDIIYGTQLTDEPA